MWGAIIGGALSAAGSLLGKPSSPPKYNPWDINMPGVGSVDFDRKNKTVTASFDPQTRALMDMLYGRATGPGYGQGMADFGQGMVGMMPGLFSDAQASSYVDPRILGNFNQGLDYAMSNTAGMQSDIYGQGLGFLNGQGLGMPQARNMFQTGMGMVGEGPGQSYQDVAQGRVDLLRQQAQSFENRAQNDLFGKLQKMGQLGMPSAQRSIQAFGQGLGTADLSRQMEGQNLAESLYGRDLSASLTRNQIGAGMAGQGLNYMGQGANLGFNFLNAGAQMNPMFANMASMGYGNNMNFADTTNARAQQRMGSAVNLFGLGSDAQSRDLQQALAAMGGYSSFQGGLMDAMKVGAGMGSANAAAGAAYGPSSNPWGGILQGMGYGMMNGQFGQGANAGMPGSGSYVSQPIYPGGIVPMLPQPGLGAPGVTAPVLKFPSMNVGG